MQINAGRAAADLLEADVFLILFPSVGADEFRTHLHASRAPRLAHTGREHNMPTGFESPGARNGMAWKLF